MTSVPNLGLANKLWNLDAFVRFSSLDQAFLVLDFSRNSQSESVIHVSYSKAGVQSQSEVI